MCKDNLWPVVNVKFKHRLERTEKYCRIQNIIQDFQTKKRVLTATIATLDPAISAAIRNSDR
jgi:hypothetical protein